MKRILIQLFTILFAVALIISCDSEDDLIEDRIVENTPDAVQPPSAGTLDASKYIAIGNSNTSGFADGALFPSGQANSYPSILADQLAIAGGGDFINPNIVSGASGTGRIALDLEAALAFLATGEGSLADALVTAEPSPITSNTESDINNFGVPGARSIDLVTPGYGAFNPFYGAFQSSETSSVIMDAAGADASLFSLWIGSNDILGYAINGGQVDDYNPLDTRTITSAGDFSNALSGTLDFLSAGGADGVILNIPPITTIPYFQVATTLGGGVELIPLTDQATVDQLNGAFNVPFPSPIEGVDPGYNTLIDLALDLTIIDEAEANRRKVSWALGANPPLITDESLTEIDLSAAIMAPPGTLVLPKLRQANAINTLRIGDLFPLPALFTLGVPQSDGSIPGVSVPLVDSLTLTESEQINIITATAIFNGAIIAEATARDNIALVDIGPTWADLFGLDATQATGLAMSVDAVNAADGVIGKSINGVNMIPISFETSELFNSIFSTDFIHPNARGSAIIANEIIKVLNGTYDAEIPEANVVDFPSINSL